MAAINKNFVVKHGIEVGDNLLYGDKNNLKVGIGTTTPAYTLDVRGGIGATSVSVGQTITANAGILTNLTATNLTVNGGTFTASGSTGTNGQYLKSTATGIEWETFPVAKASDTFTAAVGVTTFTTSSTYNVGFVDVYVNGVKLSNTEYTATDGTTVTLSNPTFGGEIVEIVAFGAIATGAGTTGISGITIKDEGAVIGSPFGITSIDFVGASVTSTGVGAGVTVTISSVGLATDANVNTTGIITASKVRVGSATTFTEDLVVQGNARIVGILTIGTASITIDGSSNTITVPNLVVTNNTTGVVASGVAVTIRDSGSDLGNASILDFGDNISVSLAAGIATITGAASAGAGGTWASNSVGIYTSRSVGIGTTNPTSALTVKGNTSLETLNVSGVTTIQLNTNYGSNGLDFISHNNNGKFRLGNDGGETTGRLSWVNSSNQVIATINGNQVNGALDIYNYQNSGAQDITLSAGNSVVLQHAGSNTKLQTLGAGVTITGTTFTNDLSVSGVSTFSGNIRTNGSNIKLGDGSEGIGNQIRLGNGSGLFDADFWIYHNSSYGNLLQDVTGEGVEVWTPEFKVANPSNPSENALYVNVSGGTELYYNKNKKFETLGAGVTITGTTFTNDLSVSGVTTTSTLNVGIGGTVITTTPDGRVGIKTTNPTSTLTVEGDGRFTGVLTATSIRATNLNVTGVSTFQSSVSHLSNASFGDSNVLYFGSGNDLEIYHNEFGPLNVIKSNTNMLFGVTNEVTFAGATGLNTVAKFRPGYLNVELYYNGDKKFETIGTGVTITGTTFTNQLSVSGISTFSELVVSSGFTTSYFRSTGANPTRILLQNSITGTSTSDGLVLSINGSGEAFLKNQSGNNIYIGNDAQDSRGITVTNSGLVGIGTTNPTDKLTIIGGDISVGINTSQGVILTSPNGTRYRLIVADNGTLSTVPV